MGSGMGPGFFHVRDGAGAKDLACVGEFKGQYVQRRTAPRSPFHGS